MAETSMINRTWRSLELRHPKSGNVSPTQNVSQLEPAGWSVISEELEFVFDVVLVAFLTVARNHFAEEARKEEKHADDQSDQ